jgi:hypothetical protein
MAPQSQARRVSNRTPNPRPDSPTPGNRVLQFTTLLKRKMSSELLAQSLKKTCQDVSLQTCPLAVIFREYGLLETILMGLGPDDLLALLLSSKRIHQTLIPRPGSLENLLGKLRCSGRGVKIRNQRHKKSTFFYAYECTEYVRCGETNLGQSVKTKPCVRCKVTTCDECRIHCVYQSNFEKPCDEDELPNFSGYILLSAPEVPILSPHHLVLDEATPKWQDPSAGRAEPYHDQGSIDVPFEDDAFGPPEDVDALLDLDLGLGRYALAGSAHSNVVNPSPVLRALYQVSEQRKRNFCDTCLPLEFAKKSKDCGSTVCQCTLRSHFLDRWLCLRCYETEEDFIAKAYPDHLQQCGCEQHAGDTICMWCCGSVLGDQ